MNKIIQRIGVQLFGNFFYLMLFIIFVSSLISIGYFRFVIYEFFGSNLTGVFIAFFVYLICLAIFIQIARWVSMKIETSKFKLFLDKYRSPTFIEKYGLDYKKPELEDFALTKEELTEYRGKFKIDTKFTFSIIGYPIGIVILFLGATKRINIVSCFILIGVVIFILLALKLFIRHYVEKLLRRTHV